jgi:protein-disulfide isomerase
MSRLSFALVLLVGLLGGAVGTLVLKPQPTLTERDVQSIVLATLKDNMPPPPAMAELDPDKVNELIESYLMADPAILDRMNDKLADEKRVAQRAAEKAAIEAHTADIYNSPTDVVLGNPNGDVTLVELFDYNCVYCRQALPDMAELMADDPNLKIILRQFPILSAGSVEAAKVALVVGQNPKINYWDFHEKLFTMRAGQVGVDQALDAAEQLGGSRVELMLDMDSKATKAALQKTYDLAKALNIGGTPTYILGDEMIPGALPAEQIKEKIANLRACGSTECPEPAVSTPAG